ncbi:MAG: CDP-diacylglycerol--serine O-phosphatidyltransferase [Parvicella sp.]|jgi:CDP-diacylglycerol--serine O-phosphatidyltransferase
MKRHIPNIITLGNLTCGILSIIHASRGSFEWSAYFIFLGLFLDFFDGFFARILKVDGEIGKQLDSLADMVTFGVAPGLLVFFMASEVLLIESIQRKVYYHENYDFGYQVYLPLIAFIIPILSAIRLAKFNISTNQSDQFIGLPTPANAIFFSSLTLLVLNHFDFLIDDDLKLAVYQNAVYAILLLTIPMSILLNIKTPLIALKFKTFGWKGNEARFVLLGISLLVILGSLLISNIFVAAPIIILLYLIISVINNFTKRAK